MTTQRPSTQIAVIGGGVIGVTTASLLQANGHPTVLYPLARPADFGHASPPSFASLHAAASILPHSVTSQHATRWTFASQQYFDALTFGAWSGVRRQRHYEIFETDSAAAPAYHSTLPDFERLTENALRERGAPVRPGAEAASGWCFSAFFAEARPYLHFLYDFYQNIGGVVASARQLPTPSTLAGYFARGHTICVVCAGLASQGLLAELIAAAEYSDRPREGEFEPLADRFGARLIRGHYLLLDIREPLCDGEGRMFSYSYTPTSEIYPTVNGAPGDVYCYPRSIGWLLGGSRQVGRIDRDDAWVGEACVGEAIGFSDSHRTVTVPAPIYQLNRDLLRSIDGNSFDIAALAHVVPPRISAGVGLRFVRDNDDDHVRVGVSRVMGRREGLVLHNYGHGGAGYTLSWGCALDVLASVDRYAERLSAPTETNPYHGSTCAAVVEVTHRLLDAPRHPVALSPSVSPRTTAQP